MYSNNIILLLILVAMCYAQSMPDPCDQYEEFRGKDRRADFKTQFPLKCDTKIQEHKWYRFNGGSQSQMMLTKCIKRYMVCGGFSAGWMKGRHPTVEEGIVNRTACFYFGRDCCQTSKPMQVRNCGKFFVYSLKPFNVCNRRYCGARYDFCDPNPCQHGSCTSSKNGYRCACQEGYLGKNCHLKNFCKNNPCQNGTCKSTSDGYRCQCQIGFAGTLCNETVPITTTPSTITKPGISKQIAVLDQSLTQLASSIGSITAQSNRLIKEFKALKKHIQQLQLLHGKPSKDALNKICAEHNKQN